MTGQNKVFCLLVIFLFLIQITRAQAPEKVGYQALIRNTNNEILQNQQIDIRISILQGSVSGNPVYIETQSTVTNLNGLVNLQIGTGEVVDGVFILIDWNSGPYYIKIETKLPEESAYYFMGTSQLISVPYALYAKSSDYNNLSNKPILFNGDYNSLTNKPALFDGNYNSLSNKPDLFDGNYNSLSNKPALFDGTWNSLLYKPDFANVAISGDYSDLIGKPALFDGNYNSLSNKPDLFDGNYNSLSNKPDLFDGTWNSISGKPTSIAGYGIEDFNLTGAVTNNLLRFDGTNWTPFMPNYLESYSETDPIFNNSPANDISSDDILNWNSAFNWGNHAGLYKPLSYTPDWNEISNNPFAITEPLDKQYLRYNATSAKWENFSPAVYSPEVTLSGTNDITYTSCKAEGNILSSGAELMLSRGFCISSLQNPEVNDTVFIAGSGTGSFYADISGLKPNHTYYIRAFATNIAGTSYSNESVFNTNELTLATLTTIPVYNISYSTAMSGGNISEDGGSAITERGICWSLSNTPTIDDNKTAEGTGIGNFNAQMSDLSANTTYYVRAYAINTIGIAYGDEVSFTTANLSLASITTNTVSNISYTTAVSGGNITSDNGSSVTSRGLCWATTAMPTTSDSKYTEEAGLGSFSYSLTGLLPATTYYVRAFAINAAGTVYGNEFSFTTLTLALPSITTKSISGISSNIAGSGGNITSDGGSAITAKGICWGINQLPTKSNSFTTDGSGIASFNSTMNGLTPLTLYYVRAYATNAIGTTYGNEISFTTTDLVNPGPQIPTVGTSASTISGSSTASSGGYVSSDGGSAVTVRGVCWSTNQNPTLADNFSVDGGTGTGYFTSTITGLSGCGTVYYVRAYATNSTGTGYGNQNTVSTGLLPVIATDDITDISYYSAVSGGNITDDGGCPVSQKGICWNYNPNPTVDNFKTTEGAGNSAFSSNITGLNANRTYYVRAYATNSVGTVYGPQKVFTTATPSTLYIGQNYAGGLIFYIDETGEHGLVCAPSNQGYYFFGCNGSSIATGTALGTGPSNTAAIVASCADPNSAAKICDNLILNGYSDWFLPSLEEANLMFSNLSAKGLGDFSQGYTYSTSSEYASDRLYIVYSYGGNAYSGWDFKHAPMYVRAIRAF